MNRLQLTQLDDGRQELVIELDTDPPYTATWRGHLIAEIQAPHVDQDLTYELTMACRQGRPGTPWGIVRVEPPRDIEIEPLFGRQ